MISTIKGTSKLGQDLPYTALIGLIFRLKTQLGQEVPKADIRPIVDSGSETRPDIELGHGKNGHFWKDFWLTFR